MGMTEHTPPPVVRHCDVAVVGGSAAGLAAALQLSRQRRSVIVLDDGQPRNAPAAHMHGYLGREGVSPQTLLADGRAEVRSYGGEVLTARVQRVTRTADGFRVDVDDGRAVVARRVLAATGLVDELPDVEGVARHWAATSCTARSATASRCATGASSSSSRTPWGCTRRSCGPGSPTGSSSS